MITGRLMLAEISNKLDRVQKDVGAIREALDDDRTQNLRAALEHDPKTLNQKDIPTHRVL
jgi:hypothetical protein